MWSPPQRLVQDSLAASAAEVPDKVMVADEYGSRTYAEVLDDALRFATVLQDAGFERGDRVALYLDNTSDCAAAIFGVLFAGGVFNVVNPQTKADKLAYILNDAEASFVVSESHSASVAGAAVASAPSVRRVYTTGTMDAPDGFVPFRDALADARPEPRTPGTIPSDLAALVYTSGTTGHPKGVMMRDRKSTRLNSSHQR